MRVKILCGRRMLFVPIAEKYKQPSIYSPVIAAVNDRLKHFAERHDRVTYVDCNHVFLEHEVRPAILKYGLIAHGPRHGICAAGRQSCLWHRLGPGLMYVHVSH